MYTKLKTPKNVYYFSLHVIIEKVLPLFLGEMLWISKSKYGNLLGG